MRKMIASAICIAALLAVAVALRLHDAPYISYIDGQPAAATEGLSRKAHQGDGFAALLLAKNYSRGVAGKPNRETAIEWYLTAAQLGEIRAISPFIDLTLTPGAASPEQCRTYVSLLDLVGRTGELNALISLGRYYKTGLCVEPDPVMAARYYLNAAQIDERFRELADAATEQIPPGAAQELTPRFDMFDTSINAALAQFLAASSALR